MAIIFQPILRASYNMHPLQHALMLAHSCLIPCTTCSSLPPHSSTAAPGPSSVFAASGAHSFHLQISTFMLPHSSAAVPGPSSALPASGAHALAAGAAALAARAAKGHASAPKKPTCPRQAADAVAGHALAPAAAVHLPHAVHAAYMPPSQPLPCPPSTPLPAVAPLLPSLHSLVEAWSLSWHLRYASAAALLQRGPPSLPPPTDVPPALSSRPPAASAAALPLPGPPSWPPPPAWHRSQLWLPPAACGTALPLPGLLPLQPPVAACPSHHPVAAPLLPPAVRAAALFHPDIP
mmetsp:Transcript_20877/g.58140  ORF Transcript_20877/g.58140 Transcript_20877/m.58140 type:complete len:293 (-) Transcript_20877:180-1058(-)